MNKPDAIRRERLAAPREHLGVLVEPAAGLVLGRRGRASDAAALLDATIGTARLGLAEALGLDAIDGPVIVAGHQAEFFHTGVFAKTIAADLLAERAAGRSIFVCVDSDTMKAPFVRIPAEDAATVARVAIPGVSGELAVESHSPQPAAEWSRFFDEIRRRSGLAGTDALDVFSRSVADGPAQRLSDVVTRGQMAIETALGLTAARVVRVSELSRTAAFRAFAAHWMRDAGRLGEEYNAAQAAYREKHNVRSDRRPVPPLRLGERTECPFWISQGTGRRQRLFVQLQHDRIELFAGDEHVGSETVDRFGRLEYHRTPWVSEAGGWQIRPRAVTLSAFLRLLAADVFIHGLGGAAYDEMTEDLVRRAFGVELSPLLCVTATLYPRLAGVDAATEPSDRVITRRDLQYNPQRVLTRVPDELVRRRTALVRESESLRRGGDRTVRRRVFEAIREVNEAIRAAMPDQVAAIESSWSEIEERQRRDAVLRDRAFFFALHPLAELARLVARIRDAVARLVETPMHDRSLPADPS